jgi:purine-nucleoside phosphorylase
VQRSTRNNHVTTELRACCPLRPASLAALGILAMMIRARQLANTSSAYYSLTVGRAGGTGEELAVGRCVVVANGLRKSARAC